MTTEYRNMTVSELTAAIIPYIESKHYSQSYIAGFYLIWKRLNEYCAGKGITEFTTEVGKQFIQECYGTKPDEILRKHSRVHRAMDMLSDFQHFGTVMLKRRLNRTFPEQFRQQAESYLSYMEKNYAQPNTILSHRKSLYQFTDFLDSKGAATFEDMTLEHTNTYIKVVLCNYSKGVAALHMGIMRKFLRYLYDTEIIADNLAEKLIQVKIDHYPSHLPTTLTTDEIERILACVDRESPMGKRDYALLLVAARLGLRGSDIRNLKSENIDWVNHEIRITQIKNKEPLTLPLPDDVGWALIDYLKNARPVSDTKEIFLQVVAPHGVLVNPDNVLIRYMRLAGIRYEKLQHHGLHILRHSAATHMLDEGIPITTIQSVLGHISSESTKRYTAINITQLKECALEVPVL